MRAVKHFKKWVLFIGTISTISFFSVSGAAEAEADYSTVLSQIYNEVKLISGYTEGIPANATLILAKINNLPADFQSIITALTTLVSVWKDPDNLETTFNLSSLFSSTKIGSSDAANTSQQANLELQLSAARFGDNFPVTLFTVPDNPDLLKTFPKINEITYSTLHDKPPATAANAVGKDGTAYIKNLGGFNIQRLTPSLGMGGNPDKIQKYMSYYDTIMAIQSFNASILSGLKTGDSTETQAEKDINDLLSNQQDWFSVVAAESPIVVLRQTLMFQSQIYVLLGKLIDAQKNMVIAQTITNTLLIVTNQSNETLMVMDATGTQGQLH